MSKLLQKLQKQCRIKEADVLSDSEFFAEKELVSTPVPMMNVALSGSIDGGLGSGLTMLAGPSKHFKTNFALLMAASYLNKYPDAVMLFYDSEFGSPQSYFKSFGIDTDRVLHVPIKTVEDLKLDLIPQLENLDKGDKVVVVVDSIGNLASKKEMDDALDGKSVADMSRAKAIKSVFRMATPYLTMKDVPMLVINHVYAGQGMYATDVVSGGTGIYLSSNTIFVIGRRQDKVGTEVQGYHFVIRVEKSRFVREKSAIPISVSWEGGIEKWSGLLEVALELGYAKKPKNGWYCSWNPKTDTQISQSNVRQKDTLTEDFWRPVFEQTDFANAIKNKFQVGTVNMFKPDDDDVEETTSEASE